MIVNKLDKNNLNKNISTLIDPKDKRKISRMELSGPTHKLTQDEKDSADDMKGDYSNELI